jgi:HlyD family secretion protein
MSDQEALEQKAKMTATPASTTSDSPEENGESGKASRRSRLIRIGAVVLLLIGALLLWRILRGPDVPDSVVVLSGRVEGDDSAIASKTSGRILEIRFREGDQVHQGEVIALLDDEQIRARENQAQATVQQARARVSAAQEQIGVLNQQLLQNQLQAVQSKDDAAGRVQQAEADLAAAQSDLAQQKANLQLAEFDRDAYTRLAKSGAVSERQGKEAASKADAQAAAVVAAKRRVEAAQGALTLAKSSLANPTIRNAQTAAVQSQILQQKAEVANAESQLSQANAQLVEAQANRRDLTIRAPFEGSIVSRTAEPGEVIAAGTAVVTMLDLNKVYLRGFIPEGQIGKVKLGQPARVYLDSATKSPLDAYVTRIDPQATFTPENTYFRDDRVKQVVGVKLELKSGIGYAKPGMPADGEILVQGNTWPRRIKRQ